MTVSTTDYRKSYTSTGGTTYAYTWPIQDDSWLAVYADGVLQTLDSDYTVTGVGDGSGGNVVFTTAPTAGDTVVIIPAVPLQQLTDFAHNSKFPEESVENAFDTLTVIAKQHEEALDRTLRFPAYSGSSGGVLPEPALNQALRWSAVTPPTLQNYTVVDDPTSITLPLTQANGGFGRDMSAVTGVLTMNAGTCYEMTGTIMPADTTDVAVQAAIDSGAKKILLDPALTYAFTSVVTLSRVSDDGGIEIDGQGATVTGDGVIANCFMVSEPATGQFNRVKIHDIKFSGTVTGAFVKVESGATYWHDYYNLTTDTDGNATAHALIEFHNTSAVSNPGGFTVHDLKAPSNTVDHTIVFSKEMAALGDYDDFHLNWIQGGNESTIYVDNGCTVQHCEIHNLLSSGHGIDTTAGGYVGNATIRRIYLEPISGISHYALCGNFYNCTITDLHGWIADYTATTDVLMAYGTFTDCYLGSLSLRVSEHGTVGDPDYYAGGQIYDTYTYVIVNITAGGRLTIDFPAEYAQNALTIAEGVWPVTFVQTPIPFIQNQDITISNTWWLADTLWTNYNQSAEATITLSAAAAGMRTRVVLTATGNAYHIKPAAGDKIVLDGTALDDGDKISCAVPTFGVTATLYTARSGVSGSAWTYDWIADTTGTWTDGGA